MHLKHRPFSPATDIERVESLLAAAWQPWGPGTYYHSGNFYWGLRDPDPQIRLWEDELGNLTAFSWFSPPDDLELQVHPAFRGQVERQILDWAEETAEGRLQTWASAGDSSWAPLLSERGYQREEAFFHHMFRSLRMPVEASVMPPGFTVRSVRGEGEVEARVAVHRAAWEPSTLTMEKHRRVISQPGYREDLDLVVVDPDGRFAACCIVWWDEASGVGQFEPVGTAPEYRRRGLCRAMMLEGCRRLRELGADEAMVLSWYRNENVTRLYQAGGFETRRQDFRYAKDLSS